MHFLLYTSTATHLMGHGELAALLGVARDLNLADNVTGMLLYKDGSFMQVIEGQRDVIRRTFSRIEKDDRHKDVTLLREGALEARNFDGWSMGFRSISSVDLAAEPGFSELGDAMFDTPEFTEKPHIALRILKSFHRNTR